MTKGKYEFISEVQLKKYAELAVRVGVNVQKNQLLVIHSDIENAVFARFIQRSAYEAGASNVIIDWTDEQSDREFYLHAADNIIDCLPDWQVSRFKEWDSAGAAYLRIISENLDVFKAVSPERMNHFQKVKRSKLKAHYANTRSYEVRWCLLAVPNLTWATKVFPHLNEEDALQSLWQLILQGARADGNNPIRDWENHDITFNERKKFLNDSQFEFLHFKNNQGTDLLVGMPKHHLYIGGSVIDKKSVPFFPNIPTEEIFSAPHKNKITGKLAATKPLIYEGNIIDDFYLTFKEGRMIDYYAGVGQEALHTLIETDEGSCYLGEIALVSNLSPLAQANTLFYNTLFDENTACHIGIGNASPSTLQNGSNLSKEMLEKAGLNTSLLLVNVTFGSKDMEVIGIKEDGSQTQLMKDGKFQF